MKTKLSREAIQKRVLKIFRTVYAGKLSDRQILAVDPNQYDKDPAEFYESLEDAFGPIDRPSEMSPDGIGGTVAQTIKAYASALNETAGAKAKREQRSAAKYSDVKALLRSLSPATKPPTPAALRRLIAASSQALERQAQRALDEQAYSELMLWARGEFKFGLSTTEIKGILLFVVEGAYPPWMEA